MAPAKTTPKKHTQIGTKIYTKAAKNANDINGKLFFSCSSLTSSQVKASASLFLVSSPFFCPLSPAPPSAMPPPLRLDVIEALLIVRNISELSKSTSSSSSFSLFSSFFFELVKSLFNIELLLACASLSSFFLFFSSSR